VNVILPVFAFANSGVVLTADAWQQALESPVAARGWLVMRRTRSSPG
jgi:Na+/H+ antiporter NhaA